MRFTAYYVEADDGRVVAFVEEMPNVITQGDTVEEAREMVVDAVQALLAAGLDDFERRTTERPLLLRETLDTDDGKVDA